MHRTVDRRAARRVIRHTGRAGIPSTTYIIIGLPGQRLGDMVGALVLLAGLPTVIGPSVFYPSPGSAVYSALQADRALPGDFALMRSSAFPVETRDASRLELVTLMRLARWLNWVKRRLARCGAAPVRLDDLHRDPRLCALPPQDCAASAGGGTMAACSPLDADAAGKILTGLMLRHHCFFGMRRVGTHTPQGYVYELFPYDTAQTVMERFFAASGRVRITAAAGTVQACTD